METMPREDGLRLADRELELDGYDEDADDRRVEERSWHDGSADGDLESLRAAFVEAFNSRDLEELLTLVDPDVEVPDLAGEDGIDAFAQEVQSIWRNAPAIVLTRGFLDDAPCAVAWLPDEESCWSRVALVLFEHEGDRIGLVALPDDGDALLRADAEEPAGDELDEWSDWGEWETGEETEVRVRPSS